MSKARKIQSKEDLKIAFQYYDFSTVTRLEGWGKFIRYGGMHHFAKIHIQIEQAKQLRNQISWEVENRQIPKEFYPSVVTSIQEIVPENLGLHFKIIDGVFHEIDSRPISFTIATYLALTDCLNQ